MAATTIVKTIIVADDTAFVRDRFRTALESAGHRVLTVTTAEELLDTVRTALDSVDLLLIDLQLANSAGLELIRKVRKIDKGRVPILVFSGTVTSAREVRELARLGVTGYINEYSAVQHILPSLAPHFFPDDHNRRTSPRVVLGMPVAYRVGNTIAAALTLNLSRGGMAVRTTSPLARDAKARVRFRLPGSPQDIAIDAKVCWSNTRVGMGLQFEDVPPPEQTAVNDFVDAHFFQPRKT